MLVKFWVDGTPKSDPSEGVWEKVKRTVFRPLIVEPINQPAANFQPSQAERQAELKAEKKKQDAWTKNKQTWGEWFGSGFSAIWPVGGLSAGRGGSGPLRSSSSSYPVKPAFGSYESGEATALLVRVRLLRSVSVVCVTDLQCEWYLGSRWFISAKAARR